MPMAKLLILRVILIRNQQVAGSIAARRSQTKVIWLEEAVGF
jgi:hypothetical protein